MIGAIAHSKPRTGGGDGAGWFPWTRKTPSSNLAAVRVHYPGSADAGIALRASSSSSATGPSTTSGEALPEVGFCLGSAADLTRLAAAIGRRQGLCGGLGACHCWPCAIPGDRIVEESFALSGA